ncbi:4209_t:CDS:2 [Acaulospora morrowiae]|uniref:4209_t:CDS:1 n=1 Tax=Acaulospora morrowiae TaxID=94023 RepID=A0A9N8ZGM4_9GLOM|nr:4209_t:CDS:2 [Acaulospora morrowiae]
MPEKCSGCNKKRSLEYENGDICTNCYSAQFQLVNSGNINIDNLIKSKHGNKPKNRLEWIPFEEFTDIQRVTEGGFSTIFTALWVKGRITGYSGTRFNRAGSEKIVLKFLKDSQNINSAFIKELNNIALTQPNSNRYIIQSYGVSQDPKTKNYIFVMPYIEHGSLREYLSKHFDDVKWMDWGKVEIY